MISEEDVQRGVRIIYIETAAQIAREEGWAITAWLLRRLIKKLRSAA